MVNLIGLPATSDASRNIGTTTPISGSRGLENLIDLPATSDACRNIETTTPISGSHGVELHESKGQSSEEEPILLRVRKDRRHDDMGKWKETVDIIGSRSSTKSTQNRARIGRQIPALKMKIEILQDDKKRNEELLEEKDIELARHVGQLDLLRRKLNRQEHEIKSLRENSMLYDELVSENSNLRRENEELNRMNQDYERNYSKLQRKYDKLKQEQEAKLNNTISDQQPSSFSSTEVTAPTQTEQKETSLTEEEKFNRDLEAAISASIVLNESNPQKKNDQDLNQEIKFALELSKKEDEIRKQREHSLAFEELFRSNVEAERAVKRKLENMKTEKENVTKRLKVVEKEKHILADEKEKLVDELECTTLCGFCAENMKDVAFEPCGHIWACSACVKSANISSCPTCREDIINVRKVFIA